MNHGMGHFHASWIPIKDYAADFIFEYFNQIGVVTKILLRTMNRCCQMTFQPFGKSE